MESQGSSSHPPPTPCPLTPPTASAEKDSSCRWPHRLNPTDLNQAPEPTVELKFGACKQKPSWSPSQLGCVCKTKGGNLTKIRMCQTPRSARPGSW